MSLPDYTEQVPTKVLEETRGLIVRGFTLDRSSADLAVAAELAAAVYHWTTYASAPCPECEARGMRFISAADHETGTDQLACHECGGMVLAEGRVSHPSGDMSLQFVAVDDLEGDWQEATFLIGVAVREAYGLEGDHEIGLTRADLAERIARADSLLQTIRPALDELLTGVDAAASAEARSFLAWSGPLSGARIVAGRWQEEQGTVPAWYEAEDDQPAYYQSCRGATQDKAAGGAVGFEVLSETFDNARGPKPITDELLARWDERLSTAGILEPRYFLFSDYD